MKRLSVLIFCLLFGLLAQAQTTERGFPTEDALRTTTLPPLDRVALAQQWLGVRAQAAVNLNKATRTLGSTERFRVANNGLRTLEAELMAIGDHVYVWVERGQGVTLQSAASFAQAFDVQVYDAVRDLWGSEPNPGVDGESRVHMLFVSGLEASTAAYFSSQHSYPVQVAPESNQREMLFFNLDSIGANIADSFTISTAAHEFQHLIRHYQDVNETSWADEGFSMFTEEYLDLDSTLWAVSPFFDAPQTQLNNWPQFGSISPHYGASLMFMDYFAVRYGLDALSAVSADPDDGLRAFDNVLRTLDAGDVNDFFADWVLANRLRHTTGIYGYGDRWQDVRASRVLAQVVNYPYRAENVLSQYAADYYVLENFRDAVSLRISLDPPEEVALMPLPSGSSEWVMYGNRGDDSHTRMMRAFDLTGVERATLSYDLWYDLETYWDYAYVTISTDGGVTWDILETSHTTTENPNGRSYGEAYTGNSRGQWLAENINLDAYTGQTVLIGFEVITDDSVTQPGLAVDNVEVAAIGYSEDFERGSGDWILEGFIRTDNRLPQRAWVQAVQETADGRYEVARWLIEPGNPITSWQLPLMAGVEQVTLAISPFAPLTTQRMRYGVLIEALR